MGAGKLDEYAIKARVFPAFLALLPLGLLLGQFADMRSAVIGGCSGLGGSALFSFVLAQWTRDAGKRRENELWQQWGGAPTTVYLRHRTASPNPILKERRKERLAALVPDLILPTVRAEAENPAEADWHYEAAAKAVIARTRDRKLYEILFQENISYGFRRNLWGLKSVAVIFCAIDILASLLLALNNIDVNYNLVSVALATAGTLVWLLAVTTNWVRRAADAYTDRLFASVDARDL